MEKGKYRTMGITAASVSAVLAAAVAWGELDLPRPAWHSELQVLELQVAANSKIIQGNLWLRLTAEIAELKDQIKADPTDRSKRDKLAILQLQLREVNGKLK